MALAFIAHNTKMHSTINNQLTRMKKVYTMKLKAIVKLNLSHDQLRFNEFFIMILILTIFWIQCENRKNSWRFNASKIAHNNIKIWTVQKSLLCIIMIWFEARCIRMWPESWIWLMEKNWKPPKQLWNLSSDRFNVNTMQQHQNHTKSYCSSCQTINKLFQGQPRLSHVRCCFQTCKSELNEKLFT